MKTQPTQPNLDLAQTRRVYKGGPFLEDFLGEDLWYEEEVPQIPVVAQPKPKMELPW